MKQLLFAGAAILAGCSTGIIPTDQGKYMVSKHGGAPGTVGTDLKADVYVEANTFCSKQGKLVETITTTTQNAIPFVHGPAASLEFRCVDPK